MRHVTFFLFIISNFVFGQSQNRQYISISVDSIEHIELIDHQNLNYDWYYGRTYHISKAGSRYTLTRVDQYNKPFDFRESTLESMKDSINLDSMRVLDNLHIDKNRDSLTNLVNSVISGRSHWYRDRIELENIDTPTEISEIEEARINALLSAITATRASYINYYLSSLNIDSIWLEENASRLWEQYKPDKFKVSEKAKAYCIKCLKNEKFAQKASYRIQGASSTSDYPFVEIRIFSKSDTIFINTGGQEPFMLPWNMDGKYRSYNPRISIALADILPFGDYSNKKRLLGNNGRGENSFEGLLTTGIIYDNCVDRRKKRKRWKLKEE
jgi:hypothetical protein